MPSHLDEEKHISKREKALKDGLVTVQDIDGNAAADALAKLGAAQHDDISAHVETAANRATVTVLAQKMYLAIWNAHLDAAHEEQIRVNEQEANCLDQLCSNMMYEAGDDIYDYDPYEEINTSIPVASSQPVRASSSDDDSNLQHKFPH